MSESPGDPRALCLLTHINCQEDDGYYAIEKRGVNDEKGDEFVRIPIFLKKIRIFSKKGLTNQKKHSIINELALIESC